MTDATFICGDALTELRKLPSASVHCIVTSPPYYQLRRYSAGPQEMGSEPTVEAYITGMVAVFAECKRILRDDGILWINIGDSYGNDKVAISRNMSELWTGDGQRESKGDVSLLLQQAGKNEIQSRSNSSEEATYIQQSFPREASTEKEPTNHPQEAANTFGGNSNTGGQMRMLRGNRTRIFMPRPYKRRRQERISEGNGAISNLSAGNKRGLTEKQVSDSLLELQLSSGIVGEMPAQHTNKPYLPPNEEIERHTIAYEPISPLNRIGLPERLALALQADGWVWRSTVVWAKSAPMPESVSGTRWERHRVKVKASKRGTESYRTGTYPEHPKSDHGGVNFSTNEYDDCPGCPVCAPNDGLVLRRGSWRPTRSYEVILMLTKGSGYYCSQEAVKEDAIDFAPRNRRGTKYGPDGNDKKTSHQGHLNGGTTRNPRDVQWFAPEPAHWAFCLACGAWYGKNNLNRKTIKRWTTKETNEDGEERAVIHKRCANCGAVDQFVDHYAVFPPSVPTWCIKVSTSEQGVCRACGAQWARIIDKPKVGSYHSHSARGVEYGLRQHDGGPKAEYETGQTIGWRATCSCVAGDPVPATVLDPFAGAGTTLLAACRLGRRSIGVELREDYVRLAQMRLKADAPLLGRR